MCKTPVSHRPIKQKPEWVLSKHQRTSIMRAVDCHADRDRIAVNNSNDSRNLFAERDLQRGLARMAELNELIKAGKGDTA